MMPLPASLPTLEGVRTLSLSGIAALPPDYLSALRQEADVAVKSAKTLGERNRAKTTADWLDNVVLLRIPAQIQKPVSTIHTPANPVVDRGSTKTNAASNDARQSLNLQRGLMRTWVVLSALWLALVAGLFLAGFLQESFGVGLRLLGVAALAPPATVLALGLMLGWVVKGFQQGASAGTKLHR